MADSEIINQKQNQEPTGWESVAELANKQGEQETNHEIEKYTFDTPFGALGDVTLDAILGAKNTHPSDKKFAQEEINRRKQLGIYDLSSQEDDVMKNLESNFYGISEGRILVPTDEYREYRTQLLDGKNPEHPKGHVRETAEYIQTYHDIEKIVISRNEGEELRGRWLGIQRKYKVLRQGGY